MPVDDKGRRSFLTLLVPSLLALVLLPTSLTCRGAGNPDLGWLSSEGLRLHREGYALKAAELFRQGAEAALKTGDQRRAVLFQNARAGALHSIYRHTEAIAGYEAARELARAIGFHEAAAVASSNLSAVYSDLGEAERASAELARALKELPAASPYLGALLAQSARLALRQGRYADAESSIREGLRFFDRLNDWSLRANLMEDLGDLRLIQGRLDDAESALVEAYRIWRLHSPRGLEVCFYRLARLRMAQGRDGEAIRLLNLSLEARRTSHAGSSTWAALHRLGLAHARTGDAAGALDYFERAMEAAREWRAGILPTLQANLAADVNIGEIAAEYSDLAASMARAGGGADLAWRAFLAVENSRATSLRLVAARALLDEPEYAELLARHRNGLPEAGKALLAMERRALPVLRHSRISRSGLVGLVKPSEALFSFKLGPARSWLWVFAGSSLTVAELPPREQLRRQIDGLRAAIEANSHDFHAQSASLYRTLFGPAPEAALRAGRWLLSLDEELFALPFAALGYESGGRFRWLVEDRSVSVIPAAALLQDRKGARMFDRLAAFGDPVYNTADSRFRAARRPGGPSLLNASLSVPRLVGSGEEVRRVAAVWRRRGGVAEMYFGGEVTPESVRAAASRGAGIIHLAGHVLSEPGTRPAYALASASSGGAALRPDEELALRLSLDEQGRPTALRPRDISSMRAPSSLIVLSGCSSGRGVVQSAAGLMGLSRAWLAAGASGVIGSLWPVSDDSGEFFEAFYEQLGAGASPPRALREAQLSMIRTGSWRSQPRHWAAWFLISSE